MSVVEGIFNGVMNYITSGTMLGLPTYVVMLFPLIIGLVVGFLARKFLKYAIIAAIVIIIAAYLGFFGLSLSGLQDLANQYGPMILQYITLVVGILPLGIGFFIGLIVGFVVSK